MHAQKPHKSFFSKPIYYYHYTTTLLKNNINEKDNKTKKALKINLRAQPKKLYYEKENIQYCYSANTSTLISALISLWMLTTTE
jgi:hypothetical protein